MIHNKSATSVLAVDQMIARLYVDRTVGELLPEPVETSYTLVDEESTWSKHPIL